MGAMVEAVAAGGLRLADLGPQPAEVVDEPPATVGQPGAIGCVECQPIQVVEIGQHDADGELATGQHTVSQVDRRQAGQVAPLQALAEAVDPPGDLIRVGVIGHEKPSLTPTVEARLHRADQGACGDLHGGRRGVVAFKEPTRCLVPIDADGELTRSGLSVCRGSPRYRRQRCTGPSRGRLSAIPT